jgi:hypothetical protein
MKSRAKISGFLSDKLKPNLLRFVIIFFFPIAKSKDLATSQIYQNSWFSNDLPYFLYTLLAKGFIRSAWFV